MIPSFIVKHCPINIYIFFLLPMFASLMNFIIKVLDL